MMNVLIALLGFLAAAHAVPAYFPHGKVVTYKYTVDVKAGIIDPAPHASQFFIDSILTAQHYNGDPTLKNAYYIHLFNVTHELYNGHVVHSERPTVVPQMLPEAAKTIQTPFIIVFDENGRLQGIKFMEKESGWSKNIKKAIASMLQLDLVNIFSSTSMQSHSFITHEDTIHGSCQVAYNVQPKSQVPSITTNNLVITKMHELKNCSHFSYQTFNSVEPEKCHVSEEDGMTTASRRVVEISTRGQEILINKIIGHSVINYFPWLANAEAHYLLTNQTLILKSTSPSFDEIVPMAASVPIDRDMTFTKPDKHYADTGDLDVTHGRHVVKLNELIVKLKKMLDEAAGYLKENHMEKKQPEWKHGQAINRILHVMSFMNVESLEEVYNSIKNLKDTKGATMKSIFLGIVPNVGTTAACLFTRNVIRQKAVSDWSAITMLSKLPMHVKIPSESLLLDMEELLTFDDSVSVEVKKASILCFSTLVHKTYADGTTSPLLNKYLQRFNDHLQNEPSYEMKMVYLMAIKNVAMVDILNILEPIIRGDVLISEKPESIRTQAIWAIRKVVTELPHYAHDLLWPILANVNLPTAVRITAYDVLMNQLPHIGRFMNMYWFMVYERNEHLYNYHVDTIKEFSESVDPCLTPVREMARKILKFTRMRQVSGPLSTKVHIDSFDETFGHGESVKMSLIKNQWTGLPYVGSVNHFTSVARKPVSRWGVHWHITGLTEIIRNVKKEIFKTAEKEITNENVKDVLAKAAANMPVTKNIEICMLLTWNDNVVTVLHYNKNTWMKLLMDLKLWKEAYENNLQHVLYDDHFEMHVPTDFGVPAVLATRAPTLDSLKGNTIITEDKNTMKMQFKMKYQEWKHGEYVMSIYNPIADAWHSIRRTGTRDVVIPTEATIVYNKDSKSIKMTLPRLPVTEYSISGLLTHAKNYVTVTDDESGALTNSCDACLHIQNVTGVISNKTHELSLDSKDTALRFFTGIYNCEGHVTPLPTAHWHNALPMPTDRLMGYKELMQLIMKLRQKIKNDMISSQGASCSNLIKVEPSIVHPASRVDLTVKINVEHIISDPLHLLSNTRIDIRGTMDVKSTSTQESVRQWDANVNFMLSPGHVNNNMKIMLTRITPGEQNLKICIEGQKEYSPIDTDILNFERTKNETNTKLTFLMGHTMENKCVRDDMDITITVKGELSEEQLSHESHERVHTACELHKQQPAFITEGQHVPKIWPCLEEAMRHTTLRKYTTNILMKKVPPFVEMAAHMLQDVVLSRFFRHISYTFNRTELGNIKVLTQYSSWEPTVDVTVLQPYRSYKLLRLPFGDVIWNILLDNVHFPITVLREIVNNNIRMCSVHPQILYNYDMTVVPSVVPERWTLLTGDCSGHTFSVFVKSVTGNRLAMKVFVGEHEMELVPTGSNVVVTVNGRVITDHVRGVLVPENATKSYDMRLSASYEHLNIDSTWVPIYIYYTVNSVSVASSSSLQGQVAGLCGSMSGLDATKALNVYTLSEH